MRVDHPPLAPGRSERARFDRIWSAALDSNRAAGDPRRLVQRAGLRSVASASRLAGIRRTDAEIRAILAGDSTDPDARQVRGYAAALDFPFPGPGTLLTVEAVGELHAVLLGGSLGETSPWRRGPCYREAFDAEGRSTGRVFATLPAHLVPETMDELLTWLELELRSDERHPLEAIALFTMAVLATSPFERGNGRLAWLLLGHLLARAGYRHVRVASLEREIEGLRQTCQDAFAVSETHFWTGRGDVGPWLAFTAELLERHVRAVDSALREPSHTEPLAGLQRAILDVVRERGTTSAGILLAETGANRNTLKDNLRRLVERGELVRSGSRRGTRYRLPELVGR